ncbi:MAG: imidazolonepropionase [Gammaproteobacteria bacterium]|nr:imidazolonepropionase [Gammaproteobacteria bacterium]
MSTPPDPRNAPRWDGLLFDCRLVTMESDSADGYGCIDDGAIAWKDGVLAFVGRESDLPGSTQSLATSVRRAHGVLVTPALIDCHTHLVFAGNRAREFEQRLQGASYEEIARAGGGILSTLRDTRAATEDELFEQSLARAEALLADGVATIEIKSGYGLDLENETKMLRVARRIGAELGITVRTTFLGAHALPPEFADDADAYIGACCFWLRELHGLGLVDAVDGFCEGIGFSPDQMRVVFEEARALGLPVKLHADQLSDLDGAALVAEFNGLSADHLEYSNANAVQAMASNGTVAVLLPGAFHVLRETRLPPVQSLRDAGVAMAVSTDLNPGTSPVQSLRLAMSLACTHFRLTPAEALRGATVNAARALGLEDRGCLRMGMRADLALWDLGHPAELSYWLGGNPLRSMVIGGQQR